VREAEGRSGAERSGGDRAAFDAFFADHCRELTRFAYLLTGEHDAADDIAAEALAEAWKSWSRVVAADRPLAYVRRIVANLAADRTAGLVRERRSWRLWSLGRSDRAEPPDTAGAVDLREALLRLPARKRPSVSPWVPSRARAPAVWKNSRLSCADRSPPHPEHAARTAGPPPKERPHESPSIT
jgi:hypothetical protein